MMIVEIFQSVLLITGVLAVISFGFAYIKEEPKTLQSIYESTFVVTIIIAIFSGACLGLLHIWGFN